MDTLLRAVKIISPGSTHHQSVADIHIRDGQIVEIAPSIKVSTATTIVEYPNLHVSSGWVDMHAYSYDPGYEQRETVQTVLDAAAQGGYTYIAIMPTAQAGIIGKAHIEYLLSQSKGHITRLLPIGTMTSHGTGTDLADMYDMYQAGAVAFSDGAIPMPAAGVVERALRYVKAFEGLIMLHPEDRSIAASGLMHEGIVSTRLGLPALPALAEEMAVATALYLLDYTESRLHLLDISTSQSIAHLLQARKTNSRLSASVNAHHLLLTDSDVGNYNTLHKVNPPLRTQTDITAIIKGIADGCIDTITSQHCPMEDDAKRVEFDKAEFGMIGLETCFAAANTALRHHIDLSKRIDLFTTHARRLLGLPEGRIAVGAVADLTLFDPDRQWTFEQSDIRSRSHNTPFIGYSFVGKALGIIHQDKIYLTDGKN